MKKKSHKTINNKCDTLWSKIVRERAGNRCEYCGRQNKMLNAHHIFGRTFLPLRWVLNNGIALCPLHHTFSNTFSAHLAPTEFTFWLVKKRGEEWYKKLRQKTFPDIHRNPLTIKDKEVIYEELKRNDLKSINKQT